MLPISDDIKKNFNLIKTNVLAFLKAIFGIIVLAEVLFIEDNGNGKSDFLYEDDSVVAAPADSAAVPQPVAAAKTGYSGNVGNVPLTWETPKPILPQSESGNEGPSLLRREMSALSQETPQPQNFPILRDEKLQKSLLRHQVAHPFF